MQCLAVYLTPTKQELQPNFQMHDSRNVTVTLVQRFCERRSRLLGVLHHHCTRLPTCVLHNGCMGLFLLHVLIARTPAHTSLLILCCPPIAAGISRWTFTTVTFSHFHWSKSWFFFFFFCRRWSSTRWMVSRSRATWYTTSLNSMWVALPKNVLSLSGISSRPRSQCGYTLSALTIFFFSGHRKFCWFCQDLYPSITTRAVSQEKALTWCGGIGKSIYSHLCLSPSKTILNQAQRQCLSCRCSGTNRPVSTNARV